MTIKKYVIKGLVQGIGYRPFVAKQADELNISGWVRNTGGIVTVLACGEEGNLEELYRRLSCDVPTGGFVSSIEVEDSPEADLPFDFGFSIVESNEDQKANLPLIPADISTCDDCQRELFDRNNRRYRHPFISCTICGPRYSIIDRLPYDRDTITMGDFEMCPDCLAEYTGKTDRRRHAQTIACKKCGPSLLLHVISDNVTESGKVDKCVDYYNGDESGDEISRAIGLLKAGAILAIKDIGGYHLACDPYNKDSVQALRRLKHRDAKAFAVMFSDVKGIEEYCLVNDKEKELLTSPARPIVLVRQKRDIKARAFDEGVCLSSPDIGAMLPCNPLQIMLVKECGPLIMTSGNGSGDVLETDDDKMKSWLVKRCLSEEMQGVTVAMLSHNRRILRPMDDSVIKVVLGRQQFIRRARGYVPNPIPVDISGEIFAAGGDLKSSFCYIKNGYAYVSQYLGDMESVSCQRFYNNEKLSLERIFGFSPRRIAVDKHPGYFSSATGRKEAEGKGMQVDAIQHHKAHVASVIAEHCLTNKVLGFAFDGTGYGDDGTIWGSEVFVWDGKGDMERVAHLQEVRLIGGDEGAKNCKTILNGMLLSAGLRPIDDGPESSIVAAAINNSVNTVTSTSMGRLFDAISALLGICKYNTYEGRAPIELENVAVQTDVAYPLHIGEDGSTAELLIDILKAIEDKVDTAALARGFIYAVSDFIIGIAKRQNIKQIVLSGGTFLNRVLTERTINLLEADGFEVYMSKELPPGDGGICLGQAFLQSRL